VRTALRSAGCDARADGGDRAAAERAARAGGMHRSAELFVELLPVDDAAAPAAWSAAAAAPAPGRSARVAATFGPGSVELELPAASASLSALALALLDLPALARAIVALRGDGGGDGGDDGGARPERDAPRRRARRTRPGRGGAQRADPAGPSPVRATVPVNARGYAQMCLYHCGYTSARPCEHTARPCEHTGGPLRAQVRPPWRRPRARAAHDSGALGTFRFVPGVSDGDGSISAATQ